MIESKLQEGANILKINREHIPFGMVMPNRSGSSTNYRYGFQRQEVDNEIKGNGNSVNYKYRMHDPRVGRFFAVDPLARDYPWNSPYAFCENVLIHSVELEGLERVDVYNQWWEKGEMQKKLSHSYIDKTLKEDVNRYDTYNSKGQVHYQEFYGQTSGRSYVAPTAQVDKFSLITTFNGEDKTGSASVNTRSGLSWLDEGDITNAPFAGASISASAEINTTTGGSGASATLSESGPTDVDFSADTYTNSLYVTTSPRPVEANAQITADFQYKKAYSESAYTTETEVNFSVGLFTVSAYVNSDGGSGIRTSVGVSTTNSNIPVTATVKTTKND